MYISYDTSSNSLMDSTTSPKGENNKRIRSWGTFLGSQHFGVKGVLELRDGD